MFGRVKKDKSNSGRRQPVVSGGGSRNVFSYHANRSQQAETSVRRAPDSSGVQKPRKSRRSLLMQIPSYVAGLAILISVGYSLTLNTNPKIIAIDPSQDGHTLLRDKSVYQERTMQILQQSIVNNLKITVNTKKISAQLKQDFPELSEVSIALPLVGRRPVVTIEAAQPAMVLTGQNNAFVVDNRGIVIMKAKDSTDTNLGILPAVEDQSGLPIDVGKAILPAENVQYVVDLVAQLKAKQVVIQSMTLPSLASELHVRVKDQPYYIKFNLGLDSRSSAGTYLALRDKLAADHIVPAEYIDVRVEERAYYK